MRSRAARTPATVGGNVFVALHCWWLFWVVAISLRRHGLPGVVQRLRRDARPLRPHWGPRRLSRSVERCLRFGPWRPRCLFSALVLYRLLREQGEPAELVIGLPTEASGKSAHAWVEIAGVDVGPVPGRRTHVELARYA